MISLKKINAKKFQMVFICQIPTENSKKHNLTNCTFSTSFRFVKRSLPLRSDVSLLPPPPSLSTTLSLRAPQSGKLKDSRRKWRCSQMNLNTGCYDMKKKQTATARLANGGLR